MRRALSIAALAITFLRAGNASAGDPDPWLGPDKAVHFVASAGISATAYAVGAALWPDRTRPLVLGAAVGAAAGAGKETLDLLGYGDPSWRDLAWDGLGVAFGLAAAWSLDLLLRGVSPEHPALGATSSALGVAF